MQLSLLDLDAHIASGGMPKQEAYRMTQLWVLLKGGSWKKWIPALASLSVIGLGILEVSHPGTMASILSTAKAGISGLFGWIGDVINSFSELERDISRWYR